MRLLGAELCALLRVERLELLDRIFEPRLEVATQLLRVFRVARHHFTKWTARHVTRPRRRNCSLRSAVARSGTSTSVYSTSGYRSAAAG